MSLVTVTMQGFAPFGALLTGAIATRIGTPEAIEIFAVIVVAAAAVAAVVMPEVRNFQADSEGPSPPDGRARADPYAGAAGPATAAAPR